MSLDECRRSQSPLPFPRFLALEKQKGKETKWDCTFIPRQISQQEFLKLLHDSWITNLQKKSMGQLKSGSTIQLQTTYCTRNLDLRKMLNISQNICVHLDLERRLKHIILLFSNIFSIKVSFRVTSSLFHFQLKLTSSVT